MKIYTKYEKYLIGLIMTDGHFANDKRHGKIRIEIKHNDGIHIFGILKRKIKIITSITSRVRDTNFKKNYASISLNIFNKKYREELIELGIPAGKKDELIYMPESLINNKYLLRGIYDGDGSLGFTAKGFPFISLVTKSEKLYKQIISLIKVLTGYEKKLNRNKRDNAYNICLYKEDAVLLIRYIYNYSLDLAIIRKMKMAKKIVKWKRPKDMEKRVK